MFFIQFWCILETGLLILFFDYSKKLNKNKYTFLTSEIKINFFEKLNI